ncbi:MAG: topoisomerase C-terminal repeat-containing protein, partial [Planctomycetota bacterium]
GYLRAYVQGSDDPDADLADRETLLPTVTRGQPLNCGGLDTKGHTTQPPARFSEASLTETLEEMGIGRPSTYASIIDTILARRYVFKKGNALVPTWVAFSVSRLLEEHLPKLVDYQFTAQMEDLLDDISRGEAGHVDYLKSFYFGDGQSGLKQTLEDKIKEVDARTVSRFPIGTPTTGEFTEEIAVRVGKFGPFLEQGTRRASIPEGLAPDELTMEKALDLLTQSQVDDQPLGHCPATGKPVYVKQGRFGPYVQLGESGDDEKPKYASLLKGMQPTDMTLEVALQLLALPRTVGPHPTSGEPIVAQNGRFGPYIKCGTETRSLAAPLDPLNVTLEQAVALLAQPKTRGRAAAAPREPLKTFDKSPVTGEPVRLLPGRYGPYVTDGTTNASLPRETQPEQLTLEAALALLAERAARGPSTSARGRGRGRAAKTAKAAPKAARKTAKKKAPKG